MGKVSVGEGTDGAEPAEKKSGSSENRPPKSGSVGLSWEKENEGSGPTGHREVGESGYDPRASPSTEAQLESPRTNRIKKGCKKRKEKGHAQTMHAKKVEAKEGGGLALGG